MKRQSSRAYDGHSIETNPGFETCEVSGAVLPVLGGLLTRGSVNCWIDHRWVESVGLDEFARNSLTHEGLRTIHSHEQGMLAGGFALSR